MAFGYRLPYTVPFGRSAGGGQLGRALARVRVWISRARQRSALRELALHELNARYLRDIGVTREQALRESRRSFWDY